MEPEDKDKWQDEDGCPEDDNDGDGIEDGADECPNDPEVKNGFEDEDGCPDEATKKKLVVVKRDRIEITDKVYFAYDSDRILPKSYELLDNVGRVINEHTEIPSIFVEGHTDSDGNDNYNLTLSDRRARSVMRYLIERGQVDPTRLQSKGFGETQPIDSNKTEQGKQNNRRVAFRIVDKDGDAVDMTKKEFKAADDKAASDKAASDKAASDKAGDARMPAGDDDDED
jgi:outer membrane protein OmpA-like peptidoglycan-associated protein